MSDFPAVRARAEVQGSNFAVFLSHSMRDSEHVEKVREQLEALGVTVWLAEHDPRPGTSILSKVESVLPTCNAVVFLITSNSVDSAYVQQEIGMARTHGLPMVPLVDRHVDRTRLGLLGELEWLGIDLDDPVDAFANVSRSLQPLILAQARKNESDNLPAFVIDVNDPATVLVLVGLGLMLGVLISSYASGVRPT